MYRQVSYITANCFLKHCQPANGYYLFLFVMKIIIICYFSILIG